MICFHGTILTCDQHNTVASYLVAKDGRICYVGNTLPSEYADEPLWIRISISPALLLSMPD